MCIFYDVGHGNEELLWVELLMILVHMDTV